MDWGDFWEQAAQWVITWIPVLGPLGILTTAVVAYFGYRQKLEADRRAQWWVRAQWGLEASLSDDPRRSLAGLALLNELKTSSLATAEDRELFRLLAQSIRRELAAGGGSSLPRAEGVRALEAAAPHRASAALREDTLKQLDSLLEPGDPRRRDTPRSGDPVPDIPAEHLQGR
ncbi:hypothetical protein [Arthrobacter sp. 7Tela_A1]|uniref:hypothetical protein n=1 Tax=Arthrobacter sp. 7Tela_A1 TaxID=3093745 RepID=UPI003BB69F7F